MTDGGDGCLMEGKGLPGSGVVVLRDQQSEAVLATGIGTGNREQRKVKQQSAVAVVMGENKSVAAIVNLCLQQEKWSSEEEKQN